LHEALAAIRGQRVRVGPIHPSAGRQRSSPGAAHRRRECLAPEREVLAGLAPPRSLSSSSHPRSSNARKIRRGGSTRSTPSFTELCHTGTRAARDGEPVALLRQNPSDLLTGFF
jgi:hypothetical protein